MLQVSINRKLCVICDRPGEQKIPHDKSLLQCDACDLVWQSHGSPIQYDSSYIEKYNAYPLRQLAYIRLATLRQLQKITGIRPVFDYGCGSGAFIDACEENRISVSGYDPATNKNNEPHNLSAYGTVTFFDVLEHIPDIERIMLMLPHSIIVAIPDSSCVFSGEVEWQRWRHYRPNEHLFYFSPISLNLLFKKYGYELKFDNYDEDFIRRPQDGQKRNIYTAAYVKSARSN